MEDAELAKLDGMDLIKRFERDIVLDCHSFTARFERSLAQRELCRRGAGCLKAITDHLRKNPPKDFMDLRTAWGYLLNQIEIRLDPKKTGPKRLKDTAGWIAWADKFSK
jgi:hypothetical protein